MVVGGSMATHHQSVFFWGKNAHLVEAEQQKALFPMKWPWKWSKRASHHHGINISNSVMACLTPAPLSDFVVKWLDLTDMKITCISCVCMRCVRKMQKCVCNVRPVICYCQCTHISIRSIIPLHFHRSLSISWYLCHRECPIFTHAHTQNI